MRFRKGTWARGKALDSAIAVLLAHLLAGTAFAHSHLPSGHSDSNGPSTSPAVMTTGPEYAITESIPLGKPDTWDLLDFDPQSGRVYVTHSSEVDVFDGTTGRETGRVTGLRDAHDVVTVPALGKGYATEGSGNAVAEFDLATLKVDRGIPTERGPDTLVYDSLTGRLFAMNGRSQSATVIDAKTDAVVARIPLGGDPEAGVSDGKGSVYVDISSRGQIVRIDAAIASLSARWTIPGCESPHGLSMDTRTARLFVSCRNSRMVILDAHNGREVTSFPIDMLTDGCVFDPTRKLIYSSNGIGTLSIVRELGPDHFVAVAEVPTKPSARTMALDTKTGRIYMVASELDFHPQGRKLWQRFTIRPGTVQLLFLDPT